MRIGRVVPSLVVTFVGLWGSLAHAQEVITEPQVDIQLFWPTTGATNFFSTESGVVNSHLGFSAGLNINYARNPLAVRLLRGNDTEEDLGAMVANRVDSSLLLAFGLFDIVELGVAVPLIWQGGFDAGSFAAANVNVGTNDLKSFVVGDVRLAPKVTLFNLGDGLFAAALFGSIIVPTHQGADYAGEAKPVYAPGLALSTQAGPFRAAINGGYRFRNRTVVEPQPGSVIFSVDDEIFARFAVGFDVTMGSGRPLEIIGEVYGHTPADNAFNTREASAFQRRQEDSRTALEGLLGVRWSVTDSIFVTLGGGGGLKAAGYGQGAPRVFAGLTYYTGDFQAADADGDGIPDSRDKCPDRPEDLDGFEDADGCPEFDNDGDNIPDEDDLCPNEPEDRDGFQDEDGCPEPDNDGDGIPDSKDKCPDDPEDFDGFEDEDGCPEHDNDKDGIPDVFDLCPNEPEDMDGFQDADGCPEPDNDGDGLPDLNDICPNHPEDFDGIDDDDGCPEDNDGDGIPDDIDQCPNEPETYNGIQDEDGCPEKLQRKSLVQVTHEKIEIKETVHFRSGSAVILPKSFGLLDQVAAVLKNYKHLRKVRIEGHTDAQGNARRNKRLSQQRAEAVRTYLVKKGIEKDRLEAVGFGQEQPIASNRTAKGREMNRRVEFAIVDQRPIGDDVSSHQPPPPPPAPADDAAIEFDLAPPPAEKAPKQDGKKEEAAPEIEFNF